MKDAQQLVVATGLFSLGGVLLGALLTPLTQLCLEWQRERRAADRAKRLVAAELLHVQLVLRAVSGGKNWPPVEDINTFLPTSAWQENRSSLAGHIDEELWDQLVMAYAILEHDRARFATANRLTETPLGKEAEGLKVFSYELGQLRRKLDEGAGGWLDEIKEQFKPQISRLNDDFKRKLAALSDDDLKKDAVIAELRQLAKELGELNRDLGDDGAWAAEIDDEIKRRLKQD